MKLRILIIIVSSIISMVSFAQNTINEGFESGTLHPLMTLNVVGSFSSAPGIKINDSFGSNMVFGFGKSNCSSSCFDNYRTTLTITFPAPTYVYAIKWKEMEIYGNWGSQGQVLLDDVVLGGAGLGALPVNSGVADASPRIVNLTINQTVTTIKFVVNDITSASEIILDDLEIQTANQLVGYEYWFNNDYANVQVQAISPTPQHVLNTNLDISALPNNVNVLNIRYKDENGVYSSTLSKLFVKLPNAQNIDNKLTEYTYWFDDDFANVTIITLPQNVKTYNWTEMLALPVDLPGGNHEFNIQFKDSIKLWSVPFAKEFFKDFDPRATFNGMESELCFGSLLNITPNVIDADSIYWDFGDGSSILGKTATSSIQYLYTTAGTYTLTASLKHLASETVNDTTFSITVHTAYGIFDTLTNILPAVDLAICVTDLPYSFGTQSLTEDGVYTEVFQTVHGCDSTVTMNFSVLPLSYGTDVQVACESFTWIDGNTYTASTNSAVHTLVGQATNTCDSIVTLNLTINPIPDNSVTQNGAVLTAGQVGASYQWLDCDNAYVVIADENGQSFTATANGNYAVEITMNGCSETSSCYAVTTVGIFENTFNHDIVLYPNPTNGKISIDLGIGYDEIVLTVQSLSGQTVKQNHYKNQQVLELNLDVPAGVYLISLVSNNKIAILKIVKN